MALIIINIIEKMSRLKVQLTRLPGFLSGRMRGSVATLEQLNQIFPEDIGLKNDLGVAHLLLGNNQGAKKVYEEVCVPAASWRFWVAFCLLCL